MRISLAGGWRELRRAIAGGRLLRVQSTDLSVGGPVDLHLTLPTGISVELPGLVIKELDDAWWMVEVTADRAADFKLLVSMVEAEAKKDSERRVLEREAPPKATPAPSAQGTPLARTTPPAGLPRFGSRARSSPPVPIAAAAPAPIAAAAPAPAPAPASVASFAALIPGALSTAPLEPEAFTAPPPPRGAPIELATEELGTFELEAPLGAPAAPEPADDFDVDLSSLGDAPGAAQAAHTSRATPAALAVTTPAPLDLGPPAPLDLGLLPLPALDLSSPARVAPIAMPTPATAPTTPTTPTAPTAPPRAPTVLDESSIVKPIPQLGLFRPGREPELPDERPTGGPVLGIDYGMSHASVAFARGGKVRVATDGAGRASMPCMLHVGPAGVTTGEEARDLAAADPARTLGSVKRVLGRGTDELEVANWIAALPFPSTVRPGTALTLQVGGRPFTLPQVVAEILGALKRRAEAALGGPAQDVVLAVPPTFEVGQRNALRQAAKLAGLRVIGLVPEPLAVALAGGVGRGQREVALVFDFGGGTLDVCVVEAHDERVTPLALAGEPWLGGDDFDLALATEVATDFFAERKIQLQNRAVEWVRLLQACEQAKRRLTDVGETVVALEEVASTAKGPIDLSIQVTRKRFGQLARAFVDQAVGAVGQALDAARLQPGQVSRVLMAGGMSRVPAVREALARTFGRGIDEIVNCEEAVALGACLQAAALARAARGRGGAR